MPCATSSSADHGTANISSIHTLDITLANKLASSEVFLSMCIVAALALVGSMSGESGQLILMQALPDGTSNFARMCSWVDVTATDHVLCACAKTHSAELLLPLLQDSQEQQVRLLGDCIRPSVKHNT